MWLENYSSVIKNYKHFEVQMLSASVDDLVQVRR